MANWDSTETGAPWPHSSYMPNVLMGKKRRAVHGATTVTPLEHSLDTCPHTNHPRLSPAEQAPTQTGPTSDNQVCKNYNHKGCKYHKKCRRIHQCLECGVVVVGGAGINLWHNAQWHPHSPTNQRAPPSPSHSKLTTPPMHGYHKSQP